MFFSNKENTIFLTVESDCCNYFTTHSTRLNNKNVMIKWILVIRRHVMNLTAREIFRFSVTKPKVANGAQYFVNLLTGCTKRFDD